MPTIEFETIVSRRRKSARTWSKSAILEEIAAAADARMRLMRLHDRFKSAVDTLGARLDPSMGRPEDLPEITDN
jgi:hypothetical protein